SNTKAGAIEPAAVVREMPGAQLAERTCRGCVEIGLGERGGIIRPASGEAADVGGGGDEHERLAAVADVERSAVLHDLRAGGEDAKPRGETHTVGAIAAVIELAVEAQAVISESPCIRALRTRPGEVECKRARLVYGEPEYENLVRRAGEKLAGEAHTTARVGQVCERIGQIEHTRVVRHLRLGARVHELQAQVGEQLVAAGGDVLEIGRASCRDSEGISGEAPSSQRTRSANLI